MAQQLQFLLEDIKNEDLVLPEFQREYTWNKGQTKALIDSLLKGYPTGSLLIWKTSNPPALKNRPEFKPEGRVNVLLDGQQRLTALYLLIRDNIPPYYTEIPQSNDPRDLHYNLKTRELKYYSRIEMASNPEWVRVVDCFQHKIDSRKIVERLSSEENERFTLFSKLSKNLENLQNLINYEYPEMRVKEDAGLKDALTVFDRVNTGGTPLSDADVALAYMCTNWEEIRRKFKRKITELKEEGFEFDLKFMIRILNAVINGRTYYHLMHNLDRKQLESGWVKSEKILDYLVNFLKDRAFIFSTDDLNTPNVLIPIVGYLSRNNLKFQEGKGLKMMLYWLYAALYKRRYSASVDQYLEKDLLALKSDRPIENLIGILEEEEGGLKIGYEELRERGVGHPLYNMMCFVIRSKSGVDWANNLDLSRPVGKTYQLQKHHIFPRAVLKKANYDTANNQDDYNNVHEIANRVPLTRRGNVEILDSKPSEYLAEVEGRNPGNLRKFFIPTDEELWKVKSFEAFLDKRRTLIVQGINDFMGDLK